MKQKKNLKGIIVGLIIVLATMFFMNSSLAASTAKISTETANLRDKASTDSKILELISKGEEVEIVEKSGDWYQVKYKGVTGYLRNDLLEVSEEKSEPMTTNPVAETETKEKENQDTETENKVDKNEVLPEETKPEEEESVTGTYQVLSDAKLKITPLIMAMSLSDLTKDQKVEVLVCMNNWAFIEVEGKQGWTFIKNLQKIEEKDLEEEKKPETEETKNEEKPVSKIMYINSKSVNMRKEANTQSEIVDKLLINTSVQVVAETDGWSQVDVEGKKGYILTALLSVRKQEISRSTDEPRTQDNGANNTLNTTNNNNNVDTNNTANGQNTHSSSAKGTGSSVVAYANKYMGYRYVYGGSSPSTGFDCSGFTSYVFKNFGISLNRTAGGQYSNGTSVTKANLQVGDLVMFGKSGINHVGIYTGGGMMIHAANPSRGITTDTINSGYYLKQYVGARRIF